jgi:hypothetical protein
VAKTTTRAKPNGDFDFRFLLCKMKNGFLQIRSTKAVIYADSLLIHSKTDLRKHKSSHADWEGAGEENKYVSKS